MKYYINKKLNLDFEAATEKVKEELMNVGFGVLTEINLHEKFKEKLDVDFQKYRILGACNPKMSHQALGYEEYLGTMLPCSIVIRENNANEVEVVAVDPEASMLAVENQNVKEILKNVKSSLEKAIAAIS